MSHHIKAKRTKAYHRKHIQVPVMPELQREFMFASHGALAALRLAPSIEAFDQLAGLFNVIHIALKDRRRTSVILASGMRAMQDVSNRLGHTGAIGIGRFELAPIELAVLECEKLVKELDIVRLFVASKKILHAKHIT